MPPVIVEERDPGGIQRGYSFFFFNIYLFIWPHQALAVGSLVAACEFLIVARGI